MPVIVGNAVDSPRNKPRRSPPDPETTRDYLIPVYRHPPRTTPLPARIAKHKPAHRRSPRWGLGVGDTGTWKTTNNDPDGEVSCRESPHDGCPGYSPAGRVNPGKGFVSPGNLPAAAVPKGDTAGNDPPNDNSSPSGDKSPNSNSNPNSNDSSGPASLPFAYLAPDTPPPPPPATASEIATSSIPTPSPNPTVYIHVPVPEPRPISAADVFALIAVAVVVLWVGGFIMLVDRKRRVEKSNRNQNSMRLVLWDSLLRATGVRALMNCLQRCGGGREVYLGFAEGSVRRREGGHSEDSSGRKFDYQSYDRGRFPDEGDLWSHKIRDEELGDGGERLKKRKSWVDPERPLPGWVREAGLEEFYYAQHPLGNHPDPLRSHPVRLEGGVRGGERRS